MANANNSPYVNSPVSPIYVNVNQIATSAKKTPSTSTKKKPECSIVLEDEEYSFSPNSDSVFELPEVTVEAPLTDLILTPFPAESRRFSSSMHLQKVSVSSLSSSAAVCRICHGSEYSSPVKGETLISACYCRGTMGLFHRSCLETWLSTSNRDQCEICKFQYFLKNPGSTAAKRNLIGDFVCWCILTPLTAASAWLCISGAIHYADQNKDTVEVPGLVCLAVFLMLTYGVWLTVSIRYHYKVWHDWRGRNQKVRVLTIKEIIQRRPSTTAAKNKKQIKNKKVSRSRPTSTSSDSIHFRPNWEASLQVLRTNLRNAAVATAVANPASLTVRFTYPIGHLGAFETAV